MNFTQDIQDFKVTLTDHERGVIKRAMLAISQIEVNVKTFWSNLYNRMPKPEIGIVGASFGESEGRHLLAYSKLLEVLGLNDAFDGLLDVPEGSSPKQKSGLILFNTSSTPSKISLILSNLSTITGTFLSLLFSVCTILYPCKLRVLSSLISPQTKAVLDMDGSMLTNFISAFHYQPSMQLLRIQSALLLLLPLVSIAGR